MQATSLNIHTRKYRRQAKKDRDEDTRKHENTLARIRYGLKQKKKETREQYKQFSKKDKAHFGKGYKSFRDLDTIESFKSKGKFQKRVRAGKGIFMSEDELLTKFGWRPEIERTPFGLRAKARAESVIAFCKKMGGGREWIRQQNCLCVCVHIIKNKT